MKSDNPRVRIIVSERGVERMTLLPASPKKQIAGLRLAEAVLRQIDNLNREILEAGLRE